MNCHLELGLGVSGCKEKVVSKPGSKIGATAVQTVDALLAPAHLPLSRLGPLLLELLLGDSEGLTLAIQVPLQRSNAGLRSSSSISACGGEICARGS